MRNTGNTVAGTVSCSMSVNSASYACNVMFVRQRYFSMARDGEEKRGKNKRKNNYTTDMETAHPRRKREFEIVSVRSSPMSTEK